MYTALPDRRGPYQMERRLNTRKKVRHIDPDCVWKGERCIFIGPNLDLHINHASKGAVAAAFVP